MIGWATDRGIRRQGSGISELGDMAARVRLEKYHV